MTLWLEQIASNFLMNIIESQGKTAEGAFRDALVTIGMIFNIVFVVELCVNMFSKFFFPFWRDGEPLPHL
jgi:hypothetical protein